MNLHLTTSYQTAELSALGAIARGGRPATCCKGCFHCCKEPVEAGDDEARNILDAMTPEEREELKPKVRAWLVKFLESGQQEKHPPDVKYYRPLNLWCPLLAKDGTCSVYDRRPLACRLHYAFGPVELCRDDDKRHQQKHALFPGLMEGLLAQYVDAMTDGEKSTVDHLGVMLALELLGEDHPSAGRTVMWRQGETLYVTKHEDDE